MSQSINNTVRYSPLKHKYCDTTSAWFVKIMADDAKRRNGKEKQFNDRINNLLLSDKILDDDFMARAWPKIIDQYTDEVEKNSTIFQKEYRELMAHDIWYSPPIWNYDI